RRTGRLLRPRPGPLARVGGAGGLGGGAREPAPLLEAPPRSGPGAPAMTAPDPGPALGQTRRDHGVDRQGGRLDGIEPEADWAMVSERAVRDLARAGGARSAKHQFPVAPTVVVEREDQNVRGAVIANEEGAERPVV